MLIFLNRTCFNGVYRENSKGEFNVPYGQPNIHTLENIDHLAEVSRKLQKTTIRQSPFNEALLLPKGGDFVYLDPPYVPLTVTASFTKYHSSDFSIEQHKQLAELFGDLDRRGCYVMMSNSFTDGVKEMYRDFWKYVVEVDANRNINCKGNLRKPVKEVLIKNY
jgi:DNA adenine methylase